MMRPLRSTNCFIAASFLRFLLAAAKARSHTQSSDPACASDGFNPEGVPCPLTADLRTTGAVPS